MQVLLDTHVFLWAGMNSSQLSKQARSVLDDSANQVYVSVGSLSEIAIKLAKVSLTLDEPFEPFILRVSTSWPWSVWPLRCPI